jgi:hypothetical protein
MFNLHYSRRTGAVPGQEISRRHSQTEQLAGEAKAKHTKYLRSNSYQCHDRSGKQPSSILRRSQSLLEFPKSVHLSQTVLIHDGDLTITQKLKLPPPPKVFIKGLEMFKSLSPGLPSRMCTSADSWSSLGELYLEKSHVDISSPDTTLRSKEMSSPQQRQRTSCESLPLNPSTLNRPSSQRQRGTRALRADSPSTATRTNDTLKSSQDPAHARAPNFEGDANTIGSKELKIRRYSSEERQRRRCKSHQERTSSS